MNVEYSGWSEAHGLFSFQIPVDETREDYEIRLKNGSVFKQNGPFQHVTRDWNCDGDVYTQFGAYFSYDGGGGEFFTPDDLVSLVVHNGAEIPGIQDPFKRPSLDEQIGRADSNRTATHHPGPDKEPER